MKRSLKKIQETPQDITARALIELFDKHVDNLSKNDGDIEQILIALQNKELSEGDKETIKSAFNDLSDVDPRMKKIFGDN